MGVEMIEAGGHKIAIEDQKRSQKVKVFLTPEEIALVDILMEKLKFSTRPPVFRFLLRNFDKIEQSTAIVEAYRVKQKANAAFETAISLNSDPQ